MNINVMKFEKFGIKMGIVKSRCVIVYDEQTFLDFLMNVKEESQSDIVIVEKAALADEFFDLKTNLMGAIHQKVVNYKAHMAIVGDFSNYESQALHDYIEESNNQGDVIFTKSINEAISYFAD